VFQQHFFTIMPISTPFDFAQGRLRVEKSLGIEFIVQLLLLH